MTDVAADQAADQAGGRAPRGPVARKTSAPVSAADEPTTDEPVVDPKKEARESKGERTRRQLVAIAIEQFGRHGYRATSVSEITRSAGLTQAASYAYFENKEALFSEAVNTDARALINEARRRVVDTPVRQLVPSFLVYLASSLDDHPLAKRVLAGLEPEAMIQLGNIPSMQGTNNDLAMRIAEGQETGEVRRDIDPKAIAAGAQTITLSLLMTMTQWSAPSAEGGGDGSGTRVTDEVILGIMAVFDAMLRPSD